MTRINQECAVDEKSTMPQIPSEILCLIFSFLPPVPFFFTTAPLINKEIFKEFFYSVANLTNNAEFREFGNYFQEMNFLDFNISFQEPRDETEAKIFENLCKLFLGENGSLFHNTIRQKMLQSTKTLILPLIPALLKRIIFSNTLSNFQNLKNILLPPIVSEPKGKKLFLKDWQFELPDELSYTLSDRLEEFYGLHETRKPFDKPIPSSSLKEGQNFIFLGWQESQARRFLTYLFNNSPNKENLKQRAHRVAALWNEKDMDVFFAMNSQQNLSSVQEEQEKKGIFNFFDAKDKKSASKLTKSDLKGYMSIVAFQSVVKNLKIDKEKPNLMLRYLFRIITSYSNQKMNLVNQFMKYVFEKECFSVKNAFDDNCWYNSFLKPQNSKEIEQFFQIILENSLQNYKISANSESNSQDLLKDFEFIRHRDLIPLLEHFSRKGNSISVENFLKMVEFLNWDILRTRFLENCESFDKKSQKQLKEIWESCFSVEDLGEFLLKRHKIPKIFKFWQRIDQNMIFIIFANQKLHYLIKYIIENGQIEQNEGILNAFSSDFGLPLNVLFKTNPEIAEKLLLGKSLENIEKENNLLPINHSKHGISLLLGIMNSDDFKKEQNTTIFFKYYEFLQKNHPNIFNFNQLSPETTKNGKILETIFKIYELKRKSTEICENFAKSLNETQIRSKFQEFVTKLAIMTEEEVKSQDERKICSLIREIFQPLSQIFTHFQEIHSIFTEFFSIFKTNLLGDEISSEKLKIFDVFERICAENMKQFENNTSIFINIETKSQFHNIFQVFNQVFLTILNNYGVMIKKFKEFDHYNQIFSEIQKILQNTNSSSKSEQFLIRELNWHLKTSLKLLQHFDITISFSNTLWNNNNNDKTHKISLPQLGNPEKLGNMRPFILEDLEKLKIYYKTISQLKSQHLDSFSEDESFNFLGNCRQFQLKCILQNLEFQFYVAHVFPLRNILDYCWIALECPTFPNENEIKIEFEVPKCMDSEVLSKILQNSENLCFSAPEKPRNFPSNLILSKHELFKHEFENNPNLSVWMTDFGKYFEKMDEVSEIKKNLHGNVEIVLISPKNPEKSENINKNPLFLFFFGSESSEVSFRISNDFPSVFEDEEEEDEMMETWLHKKLNKYEDELDISEEDEETETLSHHKVDDNGNVFFEDEEETTKKISFDDPETDNFASRLGNVDEDEDLQEIEQEMDKEIEDAI